MKAWSARAEFDGKTPTMPDRYFADYVKGNFAKKIESALGKVSIRAAETPAKSVTRESAGPVRDPRTEAFVKWEVSARNALQDRRNEKLEKRGDKQARQKLKSDEGIERLLRQGRKADEKALKAVLAKPNGLGVSRRGKPPAASARRGAPRARW